jgi:DNA-binding response OmpR family regulator
MAGVHLRGALSDVTTMSRAEHAGVTAVASIVRVARVLVVEGNAAERSELSAMLTGAGHQVETAATSVAGLAVARASQPDLVLLEGVLPDGSGAAMCRTLREDPATQRALLFVVTSSAAEADRVSAFEAGADDLVVKPYSRRELMLRLSALLRRRRTTAAAGPTVVVSGLLRIDVPARRVMLDGKELDLTRREFDVLLLLAEAKGRVLTRDTLVAQLWPEHVDSGRVVDTTMKRLRKKLGVAAESLQTVRGAGYRLAVDSAT